MPLCSFGVEPLRDSTGESELASARRPLAARFAPQATNCPLGADQAGLRRRVVRDTWYGVPDGIFVGEVPRLQFGNGHADKDITLAEWRTRRSDDFLIKGLNCRPYTWIRVTVNEDDCEWIMKASKSIDKLGGSRHQLRAALQRLDVESYAWKFPVQDSFPEG